MNLGLHVIRNPAGTYSFVGSMPRALGREVPATQSDVMAGRSYRNEKNEIVTTKYPCFATRALAVEHALALGFVVQPEPTK